jgi:hypothetical protein
VQVAEYVQMFTVQSTGEPEIAVLLLRKMDQDSYDPLAGGGCCFRWV